MSEKDILHICDGADGCTVKDGKGNPCVHSAPHIHNYSCDVSCRAMTPDGVICRPCGAEKKKNQPAIEWLSYPTNKPPRRNSYLVYMEREYRWEVAYYDGGDWYLNAGSSELITHWMPLPEAPVKHT